MDILLLPLLLVYPIKFFLPEILMIGIFLFALFKIGHLKWKLLVMLLAPIAIFLVFRGDVYLKNWRWEEFCNSRDDYFKVHETVLLSREYWDEDGWPIFHDKKTKAFLPEVFDNRYEMGIINRNSDDRTFSASGLRYIKDVTREEYLLTREVYARPFGWWRVLIDESSGNVSCGAFGFPVNEIPGSTYNHYLTSWVFIPEIELG